VRVTCTGSAGAKCRLVLKLTVREIFRRHKLISVTARAKLKNRIVVVGIASLTLNTGESRTVKIRLNGAGKKLLAKRHKLKVRLRVTQTLANGHPTTILSQTLAFKKAAERHTDELFGARPRRAPLTPGDDA
jgi:hypothetical protein